MKRFLALILLVGIAYGGWVYYQSSKVPRLSSSKGSLSNPTLSLQNKDQVLSNLESVLGESIENGVGAVQSMVNNLASPEQAPIINKAIENFQSELKQLPEDQMKKIQYNYCKGIVNEYENINKQKE